MKGLILLFTVLFSTNLLSFSGTFNTHVDPYREGRILGIFGSNRNLAPRVPASELQQAITSEFADPQAALARLEEIKGAGGSVYFDFRRFGESENDPEAEGDLIHICGARNREGNVVSAFARWGNGISSGGEDLNPVSEYGSTGKYEQFFWSSPAQRRRFMARCLARLPGMPGLKSHRPREQVTFHIPNEIYQDLHRWMATIPGVSRYSATHPKFRSAAQCLMRQAAQSSPDRTGNQVVIQRQETDDSDLIRRTGSVSEMHHLPSHVGIQQARGRSQYTYSIAFMDRHSVGQLRENWDSDEIQNIGPWPNYQGASTASVLAQALGDRFVTHLKACLLSAAINVPNIDEILPTIFNPITCNEVDLRSMDIMEQLDAYCGNGRGQSCFFIAAAAHQGKRFNCLPRHMGGGCTLGGANSDMSKARDYYNRACQAGHAPGCFALGNIQENPVATFPTQSFSMNTYYQRGCELQRIPECEYYLQGLQPVYAASVTEFHNACNSSVNRRQACTSLGVYFQQRNDTSNARAAFERGCEAIGVSNVASPCIKLAQMELGSGNRTRGVDLMRRECNNVRKAGCRPLYELFEREDNQQAMQELIRRACPFNNGNICF